MMVLDLPYSACVGRNCKVKGKCQRYLFYEAGLPDGVTLLGIDNEKGDCDSFKKEEFKLKVTWDGCFLLEKLL